MSFIARITPILGLSSLLLRFGCGDDDGMSVCTPGMSVACVGVGGCAGGQVCNAEGTGFGECMCAATDAGTDANDLPDGGSDAENDGGPEDVGVADAGDDAIADALLDIGFPPNFLCEPLTQEPCTEDQPRCTYGIVALMTDFICTEDGAIALDGECTNAGDRMTVDDCVAGTLCGGNGRCAEICAIDGPPCTIDGAVCTATPLSTPEYQFGLCI